ncbi:hypothetical protein VKT23_016929 [Stygiomarasmius scandens]|uniref:Uncharacterized protein n=1 Tax=Marasmiellus scandens TaxID=2682957 RepID=A0ABR1IUW8_9AGAR
MDLSEPTLVPRQESERYLLAVAHFARKISREKQLMRQRERNLVLRFSTAPSYLSRKYHPYKRILDNERGDIGLEGQPNAAELNRFLDAIAALERPEVAQAQVAPRQHQPWTSSEVSH